MKAWIPLTLVLALGTAAVAQADCTYPRAPDAPPDGNTATKDQMIAAKHDFDRYNGEMNSYLDCLKLEMDAATPKDPKKPTAEEKKQAAILVQKNNAAVDELQAVVGRFNEQLKIYKTKAAAPKS
jgi:signal recognition particle subunit SEC65